MKMAFVSKSFDKSMLIYLIRLINIGIMEFPSWISIDNMIFCAILIHGSSGGKAYSRPATGRVQKVKMTF